ncbi:MAG: MmgE/PrpD family protein [Dehalococcoidia bacterium]|nr:MmgE/PrpD family protein [Dehalococcoidia bacterium]
MSSTRTLASYLSGLRFEDLPPEVVEKGKLAILDAVGNCIGGYPLALSRTFLDLAGSLGSGRPEATLIGDGDRVSVSAAAFGNAALTTMLDYCDYTRSESGRCATWLGAMAVPAAMAAGESRSISGRELIASVVAGYEGAARIVHSMDMTLEQSQKIGGETLSVFAAVCAAGRALGLDEDEMLSAVGMAGIYTPVPGWYKWVGDEGLTPRKDIKQGWAWMCMTGAFAAVSARQGLRMLQENHVLDGDKGISRMVGMDIFHEERLTADLGSRYYLPQFTSKVYPGCAITHTAVSGVLEIARDHGVTPQDVESIQVVTNKQDGIGFDDRDPQGLSDLQFSMPYQVAAALAAGDGGPGWYCDSTAASPQVRDLARRVELSFDDECERLFRESHLRVSKVAVHTRSGARYTRRVDGVGHVSEAGEIRSKFTTTASQVIDPDHVSRILDTVDTLEDQDGLAPLMDLLAPLPDHVR